MLLIKPKIMLVPHEANYNNHMLDVFLHYKSLLYLSTKFSPANDFLNHIKYQLTPKVLLDLPFSFPSIHFLFRPLLKH
jgi:hypothetical protein